MGLIRTLDKDKKVKCVHSRVIMNTLTSTSVPFRPSTVQVPNLALTDTKRITVYGGWRDVLFFYVKKWFNAG